LFCHLVEGFAEHVKHGKSNVRFRQGGRLLG
jgi:hypothetical protein